MAAGRDIKFKVKLLDQSVQELELDASTLCSDVKLVLEALTNIPATRQRLIYRGRVLRDDSSLQELGIEDGHTIHLIEREAPAPAAGAGGPGRAAGAQAAPDFNSLLQGVFSALGGLGQPPAAAGAAAGAAGQQAQGPEPVHLLQSIATFLQQLQSGAGAAGGDTAMPVTSLALGGTTGTQQLQNALTTALRTILAGQALTSGQQAQLAAAASTAAAAGAAAGTGTYPYMQLVLVALGLLLTRAQAYLSGPLAAGLAQGAQQLATLAQQQGLNTAEASQALTRISGQLQSAAALLVELARAASASSVELQGTNPLLTANTAAVLQQDQGAGGRLTPAFPTLYPQLPAGMGGDRSAAGRPISLALPDFSNPADVAQFAGRLANTVLTGLGTGLAASGSSGSSAAAAGGQPGTAPAAAGGGSGAGAGATGPAAAAAPSNAQVAQMVAAALTSSLAPVIERVSADVAGAVRTGRDSISSGQFQNVSTTAANVAAQTVSGTVGRVLTSVSETLNRNLSGIEQRLQEVEREQGRQVNAIDIAAAVQHVLLPHMQPLGDVLGAAARAAASSAAAANQAAVTAATAAQEAATAAAAAGQAAAAAAGDPAPAAGAAAPSVPPAAAEGAGPNSSTSSGSQPRGLGLGTGLRGSALPAKRKAQGPAGTDAAAAAAAGTSTAPAAAAAGAGPGSSGVAAARSAATAPGAAGRGAPPPDLGALMQMMMGGAGGQQQQQQQQQMAAAGGGMGTVGAAGGGAGGNGGDLSGLLQMMGGLLGGAGGAGGGGGAAVGTGGMGGLLQMAGQIASDPAMQPLLSGMANAVLGGGGAGGGQGLGGLLGGLLGPGGLGGPGMGGPGGSGARSATVVASMDDLEQELPADLAAEWRRVLEGDERAQAGGVAQGRGPLSEVYQAGAPTAGRRGLIPGLPV